MGHCWAVCSLSTNSGWLWIAQDHESRAHPGPEDTYVYHGGCQHFGCLENWVVAFSDKQQRREVRQKGWNSGTICKSISGIVYFNCLWTPFVVYVKELLLGFQNFIYVGMKDVMILCPDSPRRLNHSFPSSTQGQQLSAKFLCGTCSGLKRDSHLAQGHASSKGSPY